jgi:hypothetical protein
MKHLVIHGISGSAKTRRAPAATIPLGKKGYFKYEHPWTLSGNILTVTFTTSILISDKLSPKEVPDVEAHERRHEKDFQRLVNQFKQSLEKALTKGNDPDMDNWFEWFDYDICVASAAFHRSLGDPMVEICMEPNTPRPTP